MSPKQILTWSFVACAFAMIAFSRLYDVYATDIPAQFMESEFTWYDDTESDLVEDGNLTLSGNLVACGAPLVLLFHLVFSIVILVKRKITVTEYLLLGLAPILVALLTILAVYAFPQEPLSDYYYDYDYMNY